MPLSGEIIVPVFENGTNIITLVGTWANGVQANATVSIDSYNVCPVISLLPGDYYDMEVVMEGFGPYQYFNFTFDEWITEFEINCTMSVGGFTGEEWQWITTWLVTNVLNGYVSASSPGAPMGLDFYHKRLMIIPGFLSPEQTPYSTSIDLPTFSRAAMGSKIAWMDWTQVFTVVDFDSWMGYETVILNGTVGIPVSMSALSCTGLFVRFVQDTGYSIATGTVINTNLLPPSDRAPIVNHPVDTDVVEGIGFLSIEWVASGNYPTTYEIYINGSLEQTGSWYAGQPNTYLIPGWYNYSIVFYDNNGQYTMDTVRVDVEDTNDPVIDSPIDKQLEEDMIGRLIVWAAHDDGPVNYTVLHNGTGTTLSWDGGQIMFSLDGFAAGIHNFTLVVYDLGSHMAFDTVIVTIEPACI